MSDELRKARRELNNLRGFIRRTGLTGYQDRSAKFAYERALVAVVAAEDALGIDGAAEVGERLDNLRREAQRAGLLTPSEILDADRAVL